MVSFIVSILSKLIKCFFNCVQTWNGFQQIYSTQKMTSVKFFLTFCENLKRFEKSLPVKLKMSINRLEIFFWIISKTECKYSTVTQYKKGQTKRGNIEMYQKKERKYIQDSEKSTI